MNPKVFQAFRQENGLIFVKNFPNGLFSINGSNVFVDKAGEMLLNEADTKEVYQIISHNVVDRYVNNAGKELLTQDYLAQVHQIEKEHKYEDDDLWKSIDGRHLYEKFIDEWKPVYESKLTYEQIFFDIKGEVVEAQDFIMPMRKIGNDLTNTLYRYNANQHLVKVACSIIESHGFKKAASSDQVQRGFYYIDDSLRFSKINVNGDSEYITIKVPELKKFEYVSNYIGEFVTCKQHLKDNEEILTISLNAFMNFSVKLESLGITVGEVIKDLNEIYYSFSVISVMKKDSANHRTALSNVLKKVKKYQQSTIEKKND
jgi:hypothetical protein